MEELTFKTIYEKGIWCQPHPTNQPVFFDFNITMGKQMILGEDQDGNKYFCGPYNRFYYLKDYGKTFAFDLFDLEGLDYYQAHVKRG